MSPHVTGESRTSPVTFKRMQLVMSQDHWPAGTFPPKGGAPHGYKVSNPAWQVLEARLRPALPAYVVLSKTKSRLQPGFPDFRGGSLSFPRLPREPLLRLGLRARQQPGSSLTDAHDVHAPTVPSSRKLVKPWL